MIDQFKYRYAFLSNFYPSPIVWSGQKYPTVEHAFQAEKVLDLALCSTGMTHAVLVERARIANLPTPHAAKEAGQHVTLRPDWEDVKIKVMENLVRTKFETHPDLAKKLLATDDQTLIEGNTHGDDFWGVYCGSGRNELGKALMRVRQWLRDRNGPDSQSSPSPK